MRWFGINECVFSVDINTNNVTVFISCIGMVYVLYTYERAILDSYLDRYRRKISSIADIRERSSLYWVYREKAFSVVKNVRRRLYAFYGRLVNKYKPNVVVFENLYWSRYADALSWYRWNPCEIQAVLSSIARKAGADTVYIDPKHTSTECPVCGTIMNVLGNRMVRCPKCGYAGNRDVVAVLNLYKRYSMKKVEPMGIEIREIKFI